MTVPKSILRIRTPANDEATSQKKLSVRGRVARAIRRLKAARRSVIHIQAERDKVVLRGVVPSPRARLELCSVAGEVDGVEQVDNQLRIA